MMDKNLDLGSQPSLKQLVYNTLHNMIIRGEIKPGERITEDELSQSMKISRAPIREGLNMLERDGFVEIIPRKGAIVSQVSQKLVDNIWMCRMALEPVAAEEAVHTIPKAEAQAVLDELSALLEGKSDSDRYINSDLAVHELYYKYLDNDLMKSILVNLRQHSVRVRWIKEQKCPDPEEILISTKEHIDIVKSILQEDEDAVYKAVLQHTLNSKERVKYSIEE